MQSLSARRSGRGLHSLHQYGKSKMPRVNRRARSLQGSWSAGERETAGAGTLLVGMDEQVKGTVDVVTPAVCVGMVGGTFGKVDWRTSILFSLDRPFRDGSIAWSITPSGWLVVMLWTSGPAQHQTTLPRMCRPGKSRFVIYRRICFDVMGNRLHTVCATGRPDKE